MGGTGIDYATLTKWYGSELPNERRYTPQIVVSAVKKTICGDADPAHICTSYVERQNWTLRGTLRRDTRLSNGFSRKSENHMAAVAINYFADNFIKIHSTCARRQRWPQVSSIGCSMPPISSHC